MAAVAAVAAGWGQEVRLPVQAAEVKFEQGRFLALAPLTGEAGRACDTELVVLSREGKEERRVTPALAERWYRRLTVRDASLRADGTLVAAVSADLPLGKSRNGLVEIPREGEARFQETGGVFCERLLAAPEDRWCLGPDLSRFVRKEPFAVLHRIGQLGEVLPVIPLKQFGLRPMGEGRYAGPWSRSDVGPPLLFRGSGAGLFAWMPNVDALAEVGAEGGVRFYRVPLVRAGRSAVSLGATESGRVFGLFPLRGAEEKQEALDTRYAFYELDRTTGKWALVAGMGDWPRGAQVIGGDGERLVVWNRMERRAVWAPAGR